MANKTKTATLRKENATTAEVSAPSPAEVIAPASKSTDEMAMVLKPKDAVDIATTDVLVNRFCASESLNPSDSRFLRETTEKLWKGFAAARANLINNGLLLLSIQEKLGSTQTLASYVRAVLVPSGMISSEGTAWTLVQQARVLSAKVADKKLQQCFATIGDGKGLIVRVEPTAEERKAAREKKETAKAHYEMSPHFARAIEYVPVPQVITDQTAEIYTRQVIDLTKRIRGKARVATGDQTESQIRKQFVRFTQYVAKKMGKHEAFIYDRLEEFLRNVVTHTEDLARVPDLVAALEESASGTRTINGTAKHIPAGKSAPAA